MIITTRLLNRTTALVALVATVALLALGALAAGSGSLDGAKPSATDLGLSIGGKTVTSSPSRRR